MLSLCRNFRILGDGGDRIILIATNSDGEQEAFVIQNPMINSLVFNRDINSVDTFNDAYRKYVPGRMSTKLELTAGMCEFHQGIDLDKQFDPVWSKSVRELLSVINNKLDERSK